MISLLGALFPTPASILKAREGLLSETPFPLLLQAIASEERTCVLELKLRQLEKRIRFEEGAPVACRSNLLHETLGKYLVEKGRVSDADYQKCLTESVQTGAQMGNVLVNRGLISPFELYKSLQGSLAVKLLDCFRWTDAKYRLLGDDGDMPETGIRMNPSQLVLTGVSTQLPFDTVATHFAFSDEQRFASLPASTDASVKLGARDVRLLQALKVQPTFAQLQATLGFETDELMRRLYALAVLGIVRFAEEVQQGQPGGDVARKAPSLPLPPANVFEPAPEPPKPAPAVAQRPPEDDPALRDVLMTKFLEHRGKDPFALLEVPEDVNLATLRRAFLAAADQLNPLRFHSNELREKAEELLAAHARAYGALIEEDQRALWRKRRQAQREKEGQAKRNTAVEHFRIRTELLDAESQFAEAKQRLEAGNMRGALEYFEYACDIEPRPVFRAWRAWARHGVDPRAYGKLALSELTDVLRADPNCEEAYAFGAEIHRLRGDFDQAEAGYRRAFKINPNNRKYVEAIQSLARRRA